MTRTPDEIKKGLECCSSMANCADGCPYHVIVEGSFGCDEMGCEDGLLPDALAYIQQLEAELDAAVNDIRLAFTSYVGSCQTCKHGKNQVDCIEPIRCGNCENEKCKCQSCDSNNSNWEWRGIQKEDGNA